MYTILETNLYIYIYRHIKKSYINNENNYVKYKYKFFSKIAY